GIFFFEAEDGIRDSSVTGVQTCALPISLATVADCVEFVGKQPQSRVREYLSVADLLLLPSQSESFGLTALEAMACEVPVIATRRSEERRVGKEGRSWQAS